jgi:hypothetical protein
MPDLQVLDGETARVVEEVCDAIVPGSARVGPAVYIVARDGIAAHAATPQFLQIRALAIEAYYSDFVAPGVDATGAWEEIDFNTPLARRLAKDWSYLGIG